ncbi:MAG: porin [Longimicrobiales bacterium]|nr:porin [Longimicrobiales bacterium]
MSVRHAALTVVLALAAHPAVSSSQFVEPRAPVERTELGGRLHFQWNTTSAEDARRSEFLLRRARIWVATRVNDWIDGAVQLDIAGGSASARYAFVRLSLSPAARISLGQLKRAFDVFELTSSADVLVVERDGDVRGAFDCAGVGGVCSYSRFSEKLLFSSLDVGAFMQGEAAGGKIAYLLSATNGPGPNTGEENGAKSFSGRVEWLLFPGSTLGMNAGLHDYPNPVTHRDAHAPALALDLEVGDLAGGFHLQAGVMTGENWLNPDGQGEASRFLAWQGIATYRIPVDGAGRVEAVEPLGRVSWGDPDRGASSDGGLMLTPGLVLHFQGKNKMGANLDVWRPQTGGTAWGLKAQTYLYF